MRRRGLEERSSARLAAELVAMLLAVLVGAALAVGAIVAFVGSPLPRSHVRPRAGAAEARSGALTFRFAVQPEAASGSAPSSVGVSRVDYWVRNHGRKALTVDMRRVSTARATGRPRSCEWDGSAPTRTLAPGEEASLYFCEVPGGSGRVSVRYSGVTVGVVAVT